MPTDQDDAPGEKHFLISPAQIFTTVKAELQKMNADDAIQSCFDTYALAPAGAFSLAAHLPTICSEMDMRSPDVLPAGAQAAWNQIAHFFMWTERWHDAIVLFESLYYHLLRFQIKEAMPFHKGLPLIKMSDCYLHINYTVLSKRYLMYALCEDAIERKGPRVQGSGVYERLSWHRVPEDLVTCYHHIAYQKSITIGRAAWFPERVLAELDPRHLRWMTEYPTAQEYGHYRTNPLYVQYLLDQLGTDQGKNLERLAHYLLSMIPGSRVYLRTRTPSSDHDVVGSFEGPGLDFRSELGRYFLCECKDWENPADVTVIAKTAYFLDSVKAQFGILFSRKGISGDQQMKYAEHELLKAYASRGIAIVVIDEKDLHRIVNGYNLLSMIRTRYEKIRLNIADDFLDLSEDDKQEVSRATKAETASPESLVPHRSKASRKRSHPKHKTS